jgi:hypothetical protein
MNLHDALDSAKADVKDATTLTNKLKAYLMFGAIGVLFIVAYVFITRTKPSETNTADPAVERLDRSVDRLDDSAKADRVEYTEKAEKAEKALESGNQSLKNVDNNKDDDIAKKINDWNNDVS